MQFCTISSGSCGNAAVVWERNTYILVDAGLSMRQITTALSRLGTSVNALSAIVVTHEHSDHTRGLAMLRKHYPDVAVYASDGTARALNIAARTFIAGDTFVVGDLEIRTFPTPHDTPESNGYTFSNGTRRLGIATDLGHVSADVARAILGCHTVLLECNHDLDMLWAGPYPYYLKNRVSSRFGHLSNADCASFALRLAECGTTRLILGHLSEENNRPELALATVRDTVGDAVRLSVAQPRIPGDTVDV